MRAPVSLIRRPVPPFSKPGPRDGIPDGAKIARLALAGLALALVWQAGCLTVVALQGFPKVEALVYIEGFCAIG